MCGTDGCLIKSSSIPCATPENGPRDTSMTIVLDHGDPTMYESYWRKIENKCDITFNGYELLSYFANSKSLCWFLESKLEEEIKRLHNVVENAIVDDHYIIVGTGSSQLMQAALYALSPTDEPEPISVVSAAPFYSSYPEVTDFVRSGLHKWAGDARTFEKDGPYIEFITSPNNPDGVIREPVVNGDQGKLIYDLAYYWPQYTAITVPANHDVMLFTISKCTGHAGSRIGWALVKDKEVARKMTKFMEISTIGVSKEAQLRAARILEVISDSCLDPTLENFFEYTQSLMTDRWQRLRQVVMANDIFVLPKYPLQYCFFIKDFRESHPAFAWLICKGSEEEDCEKLLKGHKIQTRSGRKFGSDSRNVRISMLSRDEDFNIFLQRLMAIQRPTSDN
ncbi:L-tryptophan--pyruvate aminotransferase 1-like [Solanum dulcamara]|uniref:L-tryptophan--pyruvate aminotransferase 1-like n=1 Tax=Solanum dulcamara TaxID=45834 RepID=UPI00248587DA|nr:L-tryptophan--pyruvate aminotransferase 1-like [Solanum dulcamara]